MLNKTEKARLQVAANSIKCTFAEISNVLGGPVYISAAMRQEGERFVGDNTLFIVAADINRSDLNDEMDLGGIYLMTNERVA